VRWEKVGKPTKHSRVDKNHFSKKSFDERYGIKLSHSHIIQLNDPKFPIS